MKTHHSDIVDLAKVVYSQLQSTKSKENIPSSKTLHSILEILFFTSLKTEELEYITMHVCFFSSPDPEENYQYRIRRPRWKYFPFQHELELNSENLSKLALAADPWSSSIGIYANSKGEIVIGGLIDQVFHFKSLLHQETQTGYSLPGLVQFEVTGVGQINVFIDFKMVASLNRNLLIKEYLEIFQKGEFFNSLSKLFGKLVKISNEYLKNKSEVSIEKENIDNSIINVFVRVSSRILIHMKKYNHGGAILITDQISNQLDTKYHLNYNRFWDAILSNYIANIEGWHHRDNILNNYIHDSKRTIPIKLYIDEFNSISEVQDSELEIKGAVKFIASLTRVDGLVIMDTDLSIKGFGAILKFRKFPGVYYKSNTPVINSDSLETCNTNTLGTRHRSLFSYCWNNKKSLGLVVSEDGHMRAIKRINDKLILWENIAVINMFN